MFTAGSNMASGGRQRCHIVLTLSFMVLDAFLGFKYSLIVLATLTYAVCVCAGCDAYGPLE